MRPGPLFDAIDMKRSTGYYKLRKLKEKRLSIRTSVRTGEDMKNKSLWQLSKSREGFWTKISLELRKKIDQWIRSHPNVIHSPNKADTKLVIDPFTGQKVRKNRLLLTCSVRELHRDLYHGLLKMDDEDVIDADGNELVSDTMFRKMLPPELVLLSGTHKQGCCCKICTLMSNLRSAYTRSQVFIRMKMEKDISNWSK